MISRLRSLSSKKEWNDRSWSFLLGLNFWKPYVVTKQLYINQNIRIPSRQPKDRDVSIFFCDGLLKNKNTFEHARRITKGFPQASISYIDTIDLLLEDMFYSAKESQEISIASTLLNRLNRESAQTQTNIIICTFDALRMMENYLFRADPSTRLTFENSTLIAVCPYYGDYKDIDSTIHQQLLSNFKHRLLLKYKTLPNSSDYDFTVQKIFNAIHIGEIISDYQQKQQAKISLDSLHLISAKRDHVLFSTDYQENSLLKSTANVDRTFDVKGTRTQYLADKYSPTMSLLYSDPASTVLQILLQDKFPN